MISDFEYSQKIPQFWDPKIFYFYEIESPTCPRENISVELVEQQQPNEPNRNQEEKSDFEK